MILSDNFKEQPNQFLAKANALKKYSTGWIYAVSIAEAFDLWEKRGAD